MATPNLQRVYLSFSSLGLYQKPRSAVRHFSGYRQGDHQSLKREYRTGFWQQVSPRVLKMPVFPANIVAGEVVCAVSNGPFFFFGRWWPVERIARSRLSSSQWQQQRSRSGANRTVLPARPLYSLLPQDVGKNQGGYDRGIRVDHESGGFR